MAQLRKMLGKADSPYIVTLMRLIETQSKTTIANWCITYTKEHFLSIYAASYPHDQRPEAALDATEKWLQGEIKLPEAKSYILAAQAAAREAEANPAAQAAARAIGQAAATIHTPTHSLAIAFYGAAAIAYSSLGLEATAAEYEQVAARECALMAESLRSVSIANEPNPAKINWNC